MISASWMVSACSITLASRSSFVPTYTPVGRTRVTGHGKVMKVVKGFKLMMVVRGKGNEGGQEESIKLLKEVKKIGGGGQEKEVMTAKTKY